MTVNWLKSASLSNLHYQSGVIGRVAAFCTTVPSPPRAFATRTNLSDGAILAALRAVVRLTTASYACAVTKARHTARAVIK